MPRDLFAACVYLAFPVPAIVWLAGSLEAWLLLPWLAFPLAVPLVRTVRTHDDGPTLNAALARTGMLQLVFCLLLAAGLLAS